MTFISGIAREGWARTLFVLASVSAFGLTPLLTTLHRQQVTHRICGEHGELTHVAIEDGSSSVEPVDGDLLLAGDPPPTNTHFHNCTLVAGLRFSGVLFARTRIGFDDLALSLSTQPTLRAASQSTILQVAPKASPPPA